ncbi:MAG: 1-acyl-sn-glycerol-3-phosphate acyltransferase [Actinobacteria bacterium]|nr:1-acyl-sn-glycerol-3-phosphate acyltransferase [Actinomycetota bacterium]
MTPILCAVSEGNEASRAPHRDKAYQGAGAAQRRLRRVLHPLSRRLWKLNIEGLENIPADGPAIICPNHISFFDSVFVMTFVGRNISFVGKAEYMDSWKTKHLFPALGMIPIDRSGGGKSDAALDAAEQVLRRGELFGIYPEGTRSRDGMLYKGHTGAARLALKVGCPIIPVGIIGTREIQPPDTFMPKFRMECTLRFGRPVTPDRYLDRTDDHMVWREMIDEVMFEIRDLSGQEYRNIYASKRPESLHADTAVIAPSAPEGPNSTELQTSAP